MLRRDERLIDALRMRPTLSVGGILTHIIEMRVAEATTASTI